MESLILLFLLTFLINIPFGWLREGTKKLSPLWFLYIHAPIPFIIFLRISLGVAWKYAPLLIVVAVLGQLVGLRVRRKRQLIYS
jgi:hypothetical protein